MNSQEKNESGEHSFRREYKNAAPKQKIVLLLFAVLIVAALVTGVTVAFIFDAGEPLKNEFLPGKVSCEVTESFDGTNKEDVKVKNTGDTSVYIRAAVIVTWVKTENGNTVTHSQVPRLGTDFIIDEGDNGNYTDYVANEHWVKGADGFWYHLNPVEVGRESCILIKNCHAMDPMPEDAPEGYTLSVEIVATAIQATPIDAVKVAWDSAVTGVDSNGQLQLKRYGTAAGENP